jgi:hypothetical protein
VNLKEFDAALGDLGRCLELAPNDVGVLKLKALAEREKDKEKQKAKKMYGKMFG